MKETLGIRHIAIKVQKFEECLDSSFLPDIDIMIRTGGFQRISNFLLSVFINVTPEYL